MKELTYQNIDLTTLLTSTSSDLSALETQERAIVVGKEFFFDKDLKPFGELSNQNSSVSDVYREINEFMNKMKQIHKEELDDNVDNIILVFCSERFYKDIIVLFRNNITIESEYITLGRFTFVIDQRLYAQDTDYQTCEKILYASESLQMKAIVVNEATYLGGKYDSEPV